MAEAKQAPEFEVVDEAYKSGKEGPRLDIFEQYLAKGGAKELAVGKAIDVPTIENAKGKRVPKHGFNVKLANILYHPKIFRKKRVTKEVDGKMVDVLRVYRDTDEKPAKAAKPE